MKPRCHRQEINGHARPGPNGGAFSLPATNRADVNPFEGKNLDKNRKSADHRYHFVTFYPDDTQKSSKLAFDVDT